MARIVTEIDVDVDLEDFETDDLLDEIENRGFMVIEKEESGAMSAATKDEIYTFYQDYILWKDLGMKNETFEKIANKFFEDHLDILVH